MKKYLLRYLPIRYLEVLVTFMAIVGNTAAYIQAFKIFNMKSAQAVSMVGYIIMFISMIFWLLYGYLKDIKPLIFSNIYGVVGVILVIIGVLLYS